MSTNAITEALRQAVEANVPAAARADDAVDRLVVFVERLLAANRTINLVSRKDTYQHVLRFVRESLALAGVLVEDVERFGVLESPVRLLDIGSGGGFPGLVVKIVLPGIETTLVEATRKKAAFLAEVARELDLSDCTILWARSEDLLRDEHPASRPEFKHGFEWVTTKAVGSIEQATRLAIPFLSVGGAHWTFKGSTLDEELRGCGRLFKQARLQRLRAVAIPGEKESWIVGVRRLPPATTPSTSD